MAQNLPTVDQVLNRYLEATGGRTAYEKVKSETSVGTMEMKAQGIKGRMAGYRRAPNLSYSIVEIDGVGKIEEGVSNGVVWEMSPLAGPRVKSGEEGAFAKREATVNKDLNWRDVYAKAEVTGEETIDGVACYRVVLTPKEDGRPETRYYDKQTGLMKRMLVVAATQMGDLPVETTVSAYKQFGELKAATRIVTKMASQEMVVTISSVEFNKEIPASRFEPPADIKAILAKQGK